MIPGRGAPVNAVCSFSQQSAEIDWASYIEEALIARNTRAVPLIDELFAGG
jgi:hypothetical protein